ncbi:phage tail tape measure C-terminal domain-containing protein [Chelativorans oligotrophicus]|uniref:phage tail tape measure C-terminal domain-containing protein n=1 Tax=Chelativorans oligotrophicus TaxID=449974 RepID=UPI001409E2F4|nr:phage tail tape measure C-terminal domain-containing protein [Chelativorans oligotrophicus]
MASAVIGALRVNLGIDTAAFSDGLKQAHAGLQKFGMLAKQGLLAAGAAAGTAAAAFGVMVKNTIDTADEMSKAALKIGVPIEELSRLKYAADLSGVSFEQLQTAVGRLSRVMNDAKNGSAEAVQTFDQLGISAINADGSLKSASAILAEVADRFATMPEGAEKTALAMELMGRSGANMIPLLNGGSAALSQLMSEADTFGQVFTQAMGTNAEAFNDNISRLSGTLGNLAARVATELLPHLVSFTDWLVENAPAIQQWAGVVIEQFAIFGQNIAQLKTEIDTIIAGFQAFRDGVTAAVNQVDATLRGWSEQLVGIFAAIPGQMAQIGRNIISGLWQGILGQWEIFKADVSGLAAGITGTFKSVLGIHSPSTVMAEIGQNIMQGLSQGMQSMAGSVTGGAGTIANDLQSAFQGIGSSIAGLVNKTKSWRDVIADIISQIARIALSGLAGTGGFGGILASILGGFVGFANGGSFTVGGAGGIDSQFIGMRLTPGEMVDIHKPGQDRGRGQSIVINAPINAPGADPAQLKRVEESVKRLGRDIPKMVDQRVDVRNTRKTRA